MTPSFWDLLSKRLYAITSSIFVVVAYHYPDTWTIGFATLMTITTLQDE